METSASNILNVNTKHGWHQHWLALARLHATRSVDPSTQIGCFIVDEKNRVLSCGYNSFVRGVNDQLKERLERPTKYSHLIHAEMNSITAAAALGISLAGSRLYVTGIPCVECAKAIIHSDILSVYYDYEFQQKWVTPEYEQQFLLTKMLFLESGVKLVGL
jgi:dCMP deaminase